MASLLSHRSVVEICTFIPEDEYASLPNGEWRFKAEHCVVREDWDDAGDLPPPEYFSSVGFHIATGKHSLSGSLDIVFSPGEPLMLWRATPKGFVEGLLKRYQTECNESLVIRSVVIIEENITDVWISAYYTSFPCRQCSSLADAVDKYEVFHLTPPCEAQQCLSLKYTHLKRVEVVSCNASCGSVSNSTRQLQKKRPALRLTELRHDAFRFLPRTDLDTCLLVSRLWSEDVSGLGDQLALRPLKTMDIIYNTDLRTLCFEVSTDDGDQIQLSPERTFWLPRNAGIDSAIAVNHLRNCATTLDGLTFEVDGDLIDDCIADWVSKLLYFVKNFRFEILNLHAEYAETAEVIAFLKITRIPLHTKTKVDGLRDIWLRIYYEALEDLAEEHFLQWHYMQNLEVIHLEACMFARDLPGAPTWIRGLFQLPNCKLISVGYWKRDDEAADCSAHIFVVLREVMEQFESAADVDGFPKFFELVLRQPELTWEHQEPMPTHSKVSIRGEDGSWNVYTTKNRATDVLLSVFVNTKDSVREHYDELERRFIFRKQSFTPTYRKSRKRTLQ